MHAEASVKLLDWSESDWILHNPQFGPHLAELFVEVLLSYLNLPPESHQPVVRVQSVDSCRHERQDKGQARIDWPVLVSKSVLDEVVEIVHLVVCKVIVPRLLGVLAREVKRCPVVVQFPLQEEVCSIHAPVKDDDRVDTESHP